MVEAGGGGKGEAFGKDIDFGRGERMAGEIDDSDNPGVVGVVSMVRGGVVGFGVESAVGICEEGGGECQQGWED